MAPPLSPIPCSGSSPSVDARKPSPRLAARRPHPPIKAGGRAVVALGGSSERPSPPLRCAGRGVPRPELCRARRIVAVNGGAAGCTFWPPPSPTPHRASPRVSTATTAPLSADAFDTSTRRPDVARAALAARRVKIRLTLQRRSPHRRCFEARARLALAPGAAWRSTAWPSSAAADLLDRDRVGANSSGVGGEEPRTRRRSVPPGAADRRRLPRPTASGERRIVSPPQHGAHLLIGCWPLPRSGREATPKPPTRRRRQTTSDTPATSRRACRRHVRGAARRAAPLEPTRTALRAATGAQSTPPGRSPAAARPARRFVARHARAASPSNSARGAPTSSIAVIVAEVLVVLASSSP